MPTWLGRWIEIRLGEMQAGALSPNFVRELKRLAAPGGHFSFFDSVSIYDMTYGLLEDWSLWLGDREQSPKSRRNYLGYMRSFLRWLEVAGHVGELFGWIEACKLHGSGDDDPWVHPVIVAGIAQHRLVWIHPFMDGNGRTARMLTTLLLSQRGYDFKYLLQLSTYYSANRDDYYRALRRADATGDYTDWLVYFLGGFSCQLMRIEERARSGS